MLITLTMSEISTLPSLFTSPIFVFGGIVVSQIPANTQNNTKSIGLFVISCVLQFSILFCNRSNQHTVIGISVITTART